MADQQPMSGKTVRIPGKPNPSISFILNCSGRFPTGGLRIIYEYANRLDDRGWHVRVIHAARTITFPEHTPFFKRLRFQFGYLRRLLFKLYLPGSWFKMHPEVEMLWVRTLEEKNIPDAEFIVACPVETAPFVNSYSPSKGKKFYFIQGYEDWVLPIPDLEATWKLPLRKIVVSRWLLEKANSMGEIAVFIPNAFSFDLFRTETAFIDRPLKSVLFIYHPMATKGSVHAIEAIRRLKKIHPDLIATAFGIYDPPPEFPAFITFIKNPSQHEIKRLYNSSRIFIAPSISEGWGLPAGEAMLCGCVVIATDINGHREFFRNGENGLFCTPGSAGSIAEKVEWVFSNPFDAEKISAAAPGSLSRFTWDSSVSLFEETLRS
jgi:glycosyltransferase involved in cell wall biosynthesis